jgi:hypothetical protein
MLTSREVLSSLHVDNHLSYNCSIFTPVDAVRMIWEYERSFWMNVAFLQRGQRSSWNNWTALVRYFGVSWLFGSSLWTELHFAKILINCTVESAALIIYLLLGHFMRSILGSAQYQWVLCNLRSCFSIRFHTSPIPSVVICFTPYCLCFYIPSSVDAILLLLNISYCFSNSMLIHSYL